MLFYGTAVEGRRYGCWRPGLLAALGLILLATTAILVAWALGVSGPTLLLAVLISLVVTLIIASICIEYQRRKANRQRLKQNESMGWTLSGVRTIQVNKNVLFMHLNMLRYDFQILL